MKKRIQGDDRANNLHTSGIRAVSSLLLLKSLKNSALEVKTSAFA